MISVSDSLLRGLGSASPSTDSIPPVHPFSPEKLKEFLNWLVHNIPDVMDPDEFLSALMLFKVPRDPVERFLALNADSLTAFSVQAMSGMLDISQMFKQIGQGIPTRPLTESEDKTLSSAFDAMRVGIAWSRATSHKTEMEHLTNLAASIQESATVIASSLDYFLTNTTLHQAVVSETAEALSSHQYNARVEEIKKVAPEAPPHMKPDPPSKLLLSTFTVEHITVKVTKTSDRPTYRVSCDSPRDTILKSPLKLWKKAFKEIVYDESCLLSSCIGTGTQTSGSLERKRKLSNLAQKETSPRLWSGR